MIIQQGISRPKGFMVWGGILSRGKTALRFVALGVKVDANYYITNISKPFLAKDVPHLFSKEEGKKCFFIKIQHHIINSKQRLILRIHQKSSVDVKSFRMNRNAEKDNKKLYET